MSFAAGTATPSPTKTSRSAPNSAASNSGGGGGTRPAPDRRASAFIPFATRQSKSQVAANEILKAGKKVHHVDFRAKTDTLLKESIAEYDK